MKNLHNIEKSGFHHGQYVGYSGGRVFRITRSNSSFGNWAARQQNDVPGYPAQRQPMLYAFTLEALSLQLDGLPKPDYSCTPASIAMEHEAEMTSILTGCVSAAEKNQDLRDQIANSGDC